MAPSGLEWDSLVCPLMGLPSACKSIFPTDSDNPDLWYCQIHSLWSMSSAAGCSTASNTGGSKRCRLRKKEKDDEEEGRSHWRKAKKEHGGSGKLKEVSQIWSYWFNKNLYPPHLSLNTATTQPLLSFVLVWIDPVLCLSLVFFISWKSLLFFFFLCSDVKLLLLSCHSLLIFSMASIPFTADLKCGNFYWDSTTFISSHEPHWTNCG